MTKLQHRLRASILCVFLTFASGKAIAAKVDLYFGAFDFSAETAATSGSASGAGAYKISYYLPIFDQVEVGLGYTLILADTFSGDSAFGLDVEMAYFPFTPAQDLKIQAEKTTATISHNWKPFVLGGYNARQFQSVSTQYNGFSAGFGFERKLEARYNFKGLFRYASLAGANEGTASEITILGGLTFNF
jgi:hypothetical protein